MKRLLPLLLLLCAAGCTAGNPSPIEPPLPGETAETPGAASAEEAVSSFFLFWREGSPEAQLAVTSPAWRAAQANPLSALQAICSGWSPAGDPEILSVSGTAAEPMRTARVRVCMRDSGSQEELYVFNVILVQADGQWYVDPQSVALWPVPAAPSAPADTVLYYIPSGGLRYHIDPNCGAVPVRDLPLTASFTYGELGDAPYAALVGCLSCAAPQRPAASAVSATPAPSPVPAEITLYYNPDGGTRYHANRRCAGVADYYLPLAGCFTSSQLNEAPYSSLSPCSFCGAPARDDSPAVTPE